MSPTSAPESGELSARLGRPDTGARQRILNAAIEVLKSDGYAGLTNSKVAAHSGQNKALIAYHFGSKRGLVEHAGYAVAEIITGEIVKHIERATTVEALVEGALEGATAVLNLDERIARVYFDLTAVTVVDVELRKTMSEIKLAFTEVIKRYLLATEDGPGEDTAGAASVFIIAGLEGLVLERLNGGETEDLAHARRMFIKAARVAIRP
ncbi:MAG TPA: TetR/AcrR family transcriptional regulator [Solirubrobacterales bacterium]|jgi:AcrR family transcriptional regulator|nr:TetR/AcrR family transcriptional regulator [Solirubrobacterales bacterium]